MSPLRCRQSGLGYFRWHTDIFSRAKDMDVTKRGEGRKKAHLVTFYGRVRKYGQPFMGRVREAWILSQGGWKMADKLGQRLFFFLYCTESWDVDNAKGVQGDGKVLCKTRNWRSPFITRLSQFLCRVRLALLLI